MIAETRTARLVRLPRKPRISHPPEIVTRHLGGEKYLERQYADRAEAKKRVQCQQQLEREAEEVRRARRSLDIITNKPSTEIWQRRQREKQPFKCPASAAGARMRNQQT
jgi:hypothetical protein